MRKAASSNTQMPSLCERESLIRRTVSPLRENREWIPATVGTTKSVPLQRFQYYKILFNLLCSFFILTLCGCQENAPSKPVAAVDGVKISISEFNERFTRELNVSANKSSLTVDDYNLLKEEVLNALITEKVMLLRAGELSISVSDEDLLKKIEEIKESYILDGGFERILATQRVNYGVWKKELKKRMILEKLIEFDVNAKVTATENEVRAYYRDHRKMYVPEKRAHVAQIVVREREKAETILNRLKSGEDFDKVAKIESIGPEAAKGGDLGFVSPGVMPEEIDAAIFSQPPGEIGPVIKSPYGYHIIKVIEIDKGLKKKWEDVREKVMADFRKQKEEQAYVSWLEALRSKAAIRIDKDLLKKETVPMNQQTE